MTERMNLAQYRQHVGASSVSASGRVVPVSTTIRKSRNVVDSSAAVVKDSLTTRTARPHYALGRLKTGEMNDTEKAYDVHLRELMASGEVVWFKFEGMKFRLADNTFYTPDFAVMLVSGQLQAHEVKGHWEDDARVKIKVAASLYPIEFIAVKKRAKKDGGGWALEEF